MQEASKNASELLQAEEEEKKKAEKRRMKNKKASHLRNGMPSVQISCTCKYSVCSIESCPTYSTWEDVLMGTSLSGGAYTLTFFSTVGRECSQLVY